MGATLETVVFFLIFLLGIAAGYIWRDQISRARHDRARRERKQMGQLDPSIDATYRAKGFPNE